MTICLNCWWIFCCPPWISCNLGDFQLISLFSSCRFASVGKWLLQANILTRISAFFVTNPIVLWFCAGVCKGQLSLIRKEDDIYKWVLVAWYENNLYVWKLLAPSLVWCFLVYTYHNMWVPSLYYRFWHWKWCCPPLQLCCPMLELHSGILPSSWQVILQFHSLIFNVWIALGLYWILYWWR